MSRFLSPAFASSGRTHNNGNNPTFSANSVSVCHELARLFREYTGNLAVFLNLLAMGPFFACAFFTKGLNVRKEAYYANPGIRPGCDRPIPCPGASQHPSGTCLGHAQS